jgi:murein DD-endopeptidase MepM/ murein hydrolase activator NlpD
VVIPDRGSPQAVGTAAPYNAIRTQAERMRILSTLAVTAALLFSATSSASAGEQPRGEWPLRPQPEVVERFDPPDSQYGAGHRGVDLAGAVGQVVRAALPGTITYAGSIAGRGVVVVDHGTTRTTYEPVTATVELGAAVARGDPIGTLQLGGSHCFPRACLHWGWIEGETYLDPLRLVGLGPVRLLPLWRGDPVPPALGRPSPAYAGLLPLLRLLHLGGVGKQHDGR